MDRLRGILTSLTEAANLEEAMRNEDKQPLNLAMLVTEFVDGYRISQPDHRFQLLVGADPLRVVGSPDHLAQMLDKLIDNAVQFSLPDKTILVRVRRRGGNAEIVVLNEEKPCRKICATGCLIRWSRMAAPAPRIRTSDSGCSWCG